MVDSMDREAQRREAVATLDRLRRDRAGVLETAVPDPAATGAERTDPAEIWGRRVGRGLAIVAAMALIVYLAATYLP